MDIQKFRQKSDKEKMERKKKKTKERDTEMGESGQEEMEGEIPSRGKHNGAVEADREREKK